MKSEVDLTRAIHSVAATLNDQKVDQFDAYRVQELVTGATGGEQMLIAYGSGTSGELRDGAIDGPPVARFSYEKGQWLVQRVPEARKSDELQRFEQERTEKTKTMYQAPVRGRIAIWKKRLTGG
jgi:hypothetical protein